MEDYFATSVEFSPEQADQLREEIHSLPPDRVAGWVEDFQRERGLYRPRSEQASDAAQLYKQHAVAVQLASLKAARQSSRAPDLAVQQQLGRQAVKEMYQYEMGMQRRASQAQILAERYNGFGTRAWLYLSILND